MTATDNGWHEVSAESGNVWDRQAPIEGEYLKMDEGVGPNDSRMYTFKTADGIVKVWGSTVLDSKLSEVPVGVIVRIEPLGEATGKKGSKYYDFRVLFKEVPFKEVVTDPFPTDKDNPGQTTLTEMPEGFGLKDENSNN